LKLMSQLLGLAYTCKACDERMPNFICLGWASQCLLYEKVSPKEKKWKFIMIKEILESVRPTRNSALTDVRCYIPKSSLRLMLRTKITIKDDNFKQKSTNCSQLWSTRQVCHGFLRELSLTFKA